MSNTLQKIGYTLLCSPIDNFIQSSWISSVELSSFVCELHLIIECYFSFCLTEEKETINLDGSICVPFDKVKVKLYYPTREEIIKLLT